MLEAELPINRLVNADVSKINNVRFETALPASLLKMEKRQAGTIVEKWIDVFKNHEKFNTGGSLMECKGGSSVFATERSLERGLHFTACSSSTEA